MATHQKERHTAPAKRVKVSGSCSKCGWSDTQSFVGGEEARDSAYLELMELHAVHSNYTCEGEFKFEETRVDDQAVKAASE